MKFLQLILTFVVAVTATSHDTFAMNTRIRHSLRQSRLSRNELRQRIAILVQRATYYRPQVKVATSVKESRSVDRFSQRFNRFSRNHY